MKGNCQSSAYSTPANNNMVSNMANNNEENSKRSRNGNSKSDINITGSGFDAGNRKYGKVTTLSPGQVEIEATGVYYRELNGQIRELARDGIRDIILRGVRGQRYLGAALDYDDLSLKIYGVPGEDLGFNLSGPTIEVFGHGQNAAANTMDRGKIIIHGMGGDALAYGMRGGKLFVRDDVGYRVGIHMKEYREKIPAVVIGGTSGDYLGEYMAGGLLILLNRDNAAEMVAGNSDKTLATGIHGGEIYIFGYEVPPYLTGPGAAIVEPTGDDRKKVAELVEEYCRYFDMEPTPLLERELVKIIPAGNRPFAKFYYPAYPVTTGLTPVYRPGTSPCEARCPAGVPTGRFLRHLRLGQAEEAVRVLDEVTPFRYSCCGFICPNVCMEHCTRKEVDFPVRTPELARRFKNDIKVEPVADRPEKIAVIGAGPAGLSSAYQLARRGYKVKVYDEADRPGGKMYQVISRTRLPLQDLEHDLQRITALGVEFVLNTRVDAAMLEKILAENDQVVVAVGAHQPLLPPVKGAEHLRAGLDFLKTYNRNLEAGGRNELNPGDKIVVIGGGDSAIDGIEAALNMGVKPADITVIDIKKPSAGLSERRKLEKEGVIFRYPLYIREAQPTGAVVAHPSGEEEFLPARMVLAFINERPGLDFLPAEVRAGCDGRGFFSSGAKDTEKATEKETEKDTEKEAEKGTKKEAEEQAEKETEKETEKGTEMGKQAEKETEKEPAGETATGLTMETSKETVRESFRTAHPRISVVGDVQEAGLVTDNIGRGYRCALELDALLKGEEYRPPVREELTNLHLLPPRVKPMNPADLDVEEEYDRCLHCGICVQCDRCVEACPREALKRDGEEFTVDLSQCGGCGTCAAACTGGVIRMENRV